MLTQEELFAVVPVDKLKTLDKDQLVEFLRLEQDFRRQLEKEVKRLRALNNELEQKTLLLGEQYVVIKNKVFGKSSERTIHGDISGDRTAKKSGAKKLRVMLPSQRYPDAELIERRVEFQELPNCKCCGSQMVDSGLTEDSEFVTTVPQQYFVVQQKRQKVRCTSCYGDMQTAPNPQRIKEGSSYSDEMMVDVAMTKYCDLIPVERYTAMAGRVGMEGLPPHSLIDSTHYVADFVEGAYDQLKTELKGCRVLHADETPHRMLEGSEKKSWYLWGFSNDKTSYYECQSTRSGDVASEFLADSICEYLVSDVYSGYGKAVKASNEERALKGLPLIQHVYCNAHARRKFKDAEEFYPEEAKYFLECYHKIYQFNAELKEKPPDKPPDKVTEDSSRIRDQMRPEFENMRKCCFEQMSNYSTKSVLFKAMRYFVDNYMGLTRFLEHEDLPIDNNSQERLMRNPVVGRKTWYGTHSKRGAKTAAILFSLVESCKLNGINPREYFKQLVGDLHAGRQPYTPVEFKNKKLSN